MSARNQRFYSRLQLAAHALKKISDRQLLDVAGVTTAQMSALALIASEEASTQTLLAKRLGLNDSAITAMMRRLIDLDLVERVRDDQDGRAWLLKLTKSGSETVERASAAVDQTSIQVDALLGEKTIATVVAAMELIINDLD
ncbi:MarR family transcriptional regulator [uncultured Parasphingorhabdus sp.]|uniref:MarR family winged helix-turn-helix transcriptional regulator n=1 Tax=uncultured Parasphingorhabdus sp. TaxID=2709694 RepID=UPI0030DA62DC|tara:strand:+ start:48533 stop:48958 length:426 start_codon:yes stop_codon:yes gene_type:complete